MAKKKKLEHFFLFKKLQSSPALTSKRLGNSLTIKLSQALKHLPDKEKLIHQVFKKCVILIFLMKTCKSLKEKISYILESQPKSKWTTFLDKLSISNDQNMMATHLLKILDQELILKEKDCQPFWNPAFKELSAKLLLPTEIVYQDLPLNSLKCSLQKRVELSKCLTMKEIKVPNMNSQKIFSQSSISSIVDKWENEVIESEKKIKNKNKLFKSVVIKIYPTKSQVKKLDEFIDTHRYVYNRTLEYVKKLGYESHFEDLRDLLATENTKKPYAINTYFKPLLNNLKEKVNSEKDINIKSDLKKCLDEDEKYLKEELKKLPYIKNNMIKNFELETSNEIRSNAIKSVCDAYKSGFTNLKNGNIKFFNMHFKKKNEPNKCVELANSEINIYNGKIKICPGKLKDPLKMSLKNSKRYKNLKIENNCDLIKNNNGFFIIIPVAIRRQKVCTENNICGIDPGVRDFCTVYNPDKNVYVYTHKKELLDKLNKKIDLLKTFRIKPKLNKNRTRKVKFRKLEMKKSNIVNELHWKTINNLLKHNDIIFYGDIKSHDIVKNGKNKTLNRNFNDLKFYKFKTRLLYKALRNGKKVILTNESYTSQGCSQCGNLWKTLGSAKIYNCEKCKFICDRDLNASKNILMKGLYKYMLPLI